MKPTASSRFVRWSHWNAAGPLFCLVLSGCGAGGDAVVDPTAKASAAPVDAIPADETGSGRVAAVAGEWPQFRGPGGEGHSNANDLPLTWSESENIAWKVPVAGKGWSSPAILGDRIWLTTALDDGKSLRAVCLARETGAVLHDVEIFRLEDPGAIHEKNSHASPTPVLEGDRVYLHFGAHGTAALTTDGKIVWKTKLDYDHRHGPGGSPALYENLLLIASDGVKTQFFVALDKNTGEDAWRKDRPDTLMAYCTPLVVNVAGKPQVVIPGGKRCVAYEPKTGAELWRADYGAGYSVVPRPVFGHGLLFYSSGYDSPVFH
ncbi:MAG: PQQ-binding-like beta-propeller repeat protein, partial [Planctomycetia bacterium]